MIFHAKTFDKSALACLLNQNARNLGSVKSHFLGPQKAHSRTMISHLKLPKDNHQSLLRHQGSTQWNKCGTQWNHPPLLGNYPQCTKRGKEDLNSPIKGHQEMNNLRAHCYDGQNCPKKYQQCVVQSRDRGDSVVGHPTTPIHHSRKRETLCQGSSEVNTSFHRVL